MVEIIWTETALADLDAVADYIAVENPGAAVAFVHRVLDHVEKLCDHPEFGPHSPELEGSRYRQIVEPPCRIFYRHQGKKLYIVHVMRSERLLKKLPF